MRKCIHKLAMALVAIISLAIPSLQAGGLQNLNYMTESYPPYNFKAKGELRGIAVDLLQEALKQIKQPVDVNKIQLLPWVRAYKKTQSGPANVLFSTTRTEARENQFKWVGPISPTRIVLLAHKSQNIKINSPADIKNYKIGAIRDDVGEQLIKELGIPANKINPSSSAASLVQMLNNNRIQLWAYEENVARWFIKQADLNNADFDTVHVLKEGDLYYAFSNDVDDALLQELQKGIDAVKSTRGASDATLYDEIMGRYL